MSKDHALEVSSAQNLKEGEEGPKDSDSNHDGYFCRTPTGQEHRIPPIQSCPPAPKRPNRLVLRKRKWPELQFFEYTGRNEVESFLRSCSEFSRVSLGTPAKKRLKISHETS